MAKTLLAIDYGMQRLGVAVGTFLNEQLTTSQPIAIIQSAVRSEQLEALTRLINEWQPNEIVIGYPDNHNALLQAAIKRLGNQLRERCKLPVHFINEAYSSAEASQRLAAQGVRGFAQKPQLDAVAAQVILEQYLAQPT
jgi:putative holliday junction resolvase